MDYGIKRVPTEWPTARCYHVFDRRNRLVLVADHGTPWLRPDPQQQVRFADPSGAVVASMDLTWMAPKRRNGRQHIAYAIIQDHAVYAIINKYWEDASKDDVLPYYVLEVADTLWLALAGPDAERRLAFYDAVPSDLMIYKQPQQSDLPQPIGYMYAGLGEYAYNVAAPVQQIAHPALAALALAFLIDG